MKKILTKNNIVSSLIILILGTFLILSGVLNANLYQSKQKVFAELTEAKKPSLVEKQYTELKNLEKKWQELEENLNKLRQEIKTTTEEKLVVEKSIQDKRKVFFSKK